MRTDLPLSLTVTEAENERAIRLHERAIVFDCGSVVKEEPEHFDRARFGGVTGTNHTVTHPHSNFEQATRDMARCARWIRENSDQGLLARTVADIEKAKSSGREAIVFGPQNSEFIGTDLDNLNVAYELGMRIMQLTYQRQNWVASGSGESIDSGLTVFGKQVVAEMDELGIVVDLSHCGPVTCAQGIEASSNPVIFSHAHALAVSRPNPKAKSDDLLRALAAGGGVIGITALSTFNEDPERLGERPGLEDFRKHITYVAELIGVDHVGIGLDFDETNTPENYAADDLRFPELVSGFGWDDKRIHDLIDSSYELNVTRALVTAGFTDDEILRILGGNFLRVFEQVWK